MIRVNRTLLREMARLYILANTPYSLYHGLRQSRGVQQLVADHFPSELEQYYDHLTTRARRTEIEIGLAYGLLVALLTCDTPPTAIDASRLRWGNEIQELVQKSGQTNQHYVIRGGFEPPRVKYHQETSTSTLIVPGTADGHRSS